MQFVRPAIKIGDLEYTHKNSLGEYARVITDEIKGKPNKSVIMVRGVCGTERIAEVFKKPKDVLTVQESDLTQVVRTINWNNNTKTEDIFLPIKTQNLNIYDAYNMVNQGYFVKRGNNPFKMLVSAERFISCDRNTTNIGPAISLPFQNDTLLLLTHADMLAEDWRLANKFEIYGEIEDMLTYIVDNAKIYTKNGYRVKDTAIAVAANVEPIATIQNRTTVENDTQKIAAIWLSNNSDLFDRLRVQGDYRVGVGITNDPTLSTLSPIYEEDINISPEIRLTVLLAYMPISISEDGKHFFYNDKEAEKSYEIDVNAITNFDIASIPEDQQERVLKWFLDANVDNKLREKIRQSQAGIAVSYIIAKNKQELLLPFIEKYLDGKEIPSDTLLSRSLELTYAVLSKKRTTVKLFTKDQWITISKHLTTTEKLVEFIDSLIEYLGSKEYWLEMFKSIPLSEYTKEDFILLSTVAGTYGEIINGYNSSEKTNIFEMVMETVLPKTYSALKQAQTDDPEHNPRKALDKCRLAAEQYLIDNKLWITPTPTGWLGYEVPELDKLIYRVWVEHAIDEAMKREIAEDKFIEIFFCTCCVYREEFGKIHKVLDDIMSKAI